MDVYNFWIKRHPKLVVIRNFYEYSSCIESRPSLRGWVTLFHTFSITALVLQRKWCRYGKPTSVCLLRIPCSRTGSAKNAGVRRWMTMLSPASMQRHLRGLPDFDSFSQHRKRVIGLLPFLMILTPIPQPSGRPCSAFAAACSLKPIRTALAVA